MNSRQDPGLPLPDISPHLKEKEGFCHPDWEAIGRQIEDSVPESNWDAAWQAAARQWIGRLCHRLGDGYHAHETANFMIVSEASKELIAEAGNFFEQALVQTLRALAGIARDEGYGKGVVLMFSLPADYYQYISYFYPEGEHPNSGGIYLFGEGYAHFAFPTTDYSSYRAILVHELAHGCLAHLSLPLWLDEAMAMRMENAVCQTQPLELNREIHQRHMSHWNSKTIQQFWSGESWERPGDSSELSYSLAQVIWRKIEVDLGASRPAVLEFISSAETKDAGEAACIRLFDVSLGELAGDFLGESDWTPKPHLWPKHRLKTTGAGV